MRRLAIRVEQVPSFASLRKAGEPADAARAAEDDTLAARALVHRQAPRVPHVAHHELQVARRDHRRAVSPAPSALRAIAGVCADSDIAETTVRAESKASHSICTTRLWDGSCGLQYLGE